MKSRNVAIVAVGAVFAALIVLAISLSQAGDQPPDGFTAFDGEVGVDGTDVGGLAVPTATDRRARADSEPETDAPAKPPTDPLAAVRGSEDALNRMGPVGDGSTETSPGVDTDEDPTLPRGIVDKEDVQAGIEEVRPLVKQCYDEALVDFPEAAGKVTVGFRIIAEDGEGRVEMSELNEENTDLFDVKLHDCMLQSIGQARFDAPQSGGVVNVTYPFQFQSDPADEEAE